MTMVDLSTSICVRWRMARIHAVLDTRLLLMVLLPACAVARPPAAASPTTPSAASPTTPSAASPPPRQPSSPPPPPPGSAEAEAAAAEPELPHPLQMADLSSTSYVSLVSRYGHGSLGNIGTGDAKILPMVLEVQLDIAATPNLKIEGGVPIAMVLATFTDSTGLSTSDLGLMLGNVWLGGRYVQPVELGGATFDVGASAAVFLPTAQDNSPSTTSMSVAAGNASLLAEAFESSHDVGRYGRDQTTIHLAGDARMRQGRMFGQVELGIDRASYSIMGVDSSQLWFRACVGGGVLLGASNRAAFLAELTSFSDFLDSVAAGDGLLAAVDVGFQFRKAKQLMSLALYIPIDTFARDHNYIGLQFTSHMGF